MGSYVVGCVILTYLGIMDTRKLFIDGVYVVARVVTEVLWIGCTYAYLC